jgi:DNA-binding winged helix-turn-helix (wHTH) protein
MNGTSIAFGDFVLERENRLLLRDGVPVELSSRYLDALILLASQPGALISKDRFMDEVWRGVPVTDEALTQCIKSLRRVLGDDAARPRFIETVPKHGYRFVAAVEVAQSPSRLREESGNGDSPTHSDRHPTPPASGRGVTTFFQLAGAGVVGGGLAGLLGGIVYGFMGAGQNGAGGASVVLVLTALCVLVSLVGAAGVSLGIAAALVRGGGWLWHVCGGALGGLLIGGIAKLLGLDAFDLLLGTSPGNITGALEGAGLGGAVGLGVWLGRGGQTIARSALPAALAGGLAGMAIPALGGRMMAGSLDLLAQILPQSRLRLDGVGALFGEEGLGPVSQIVTGGLEAALFAGFIAGAMLLARRQMVS